jgi:predicted HD phosphohydrolase
MADPAATGRMGAWGVARHEQLGGDLCTAVGLPPAVGHLVRSHVQAKRYLCWKQPVCDAAVRYERVDLYVGPSQS